MHIRVIDINGQSVNAIVDDESIEELVERCRKEKWLVLSGYYSDIAVNTENIVAIKQINHDDGYMEA
jgi:hypothetical protein